MHRGPGCEKNGAHQAAAVRRRKGTHVNKTNHKHLTIEEIERRNAIIAQHPNASSGDLAPLLGLTAGGVQSFLGQRKNMEKRLRSKAGKTPTPASSALARAFGLDATPVERRLVAIANLIGIDRASGILLAHRDALLREAATA